MGETADQLRRQVDQKRDDASQKIDQIEQKVMGKAQEIEGKVSDTADQVRTQMNWRYQVEEHPLISVGAAMVGGMVLGSMMGKDEGHHQSSQDVHVTQRDMHRGGGIGESVRKAARSSGLDDSVQNFASAAMGMLGERMRDMTERTFPGMLDKVQSAADRVSEAGRANTSSFADAGPNSSNYAT
jgi:ElaB/YqjD/DUF883 family membrane-anchored ribosome-binding protein